MGEIVRDMSGNMRDSNRGMSVGMGRVIVGVLLTMAVVLVWWVGEVSKREMAWWSTRESGAGDRVSIVESVEYP